MASLLSQHPDKKEGKDKKEKEEKRVPTRRRNGRAQKQDRG